MVSYVTLGTNDFERAAKFYDALLADVGAKRLMENERIILWGSPGAALLAVCKPFDGKTASVGNGVMVALAASSPEQVSAIHNKALELGGMDEGAPGPRGDGGMTIGYFRDLDGNKLNAIHMG
jgi:predicted lactoylglutathione lyase